MTVPSSSPPARTYRVPQRFGISAILALTTLFAFLFAILRLREAPPVVYLFFGTLAIAICLAQMALGKVPRLASIAAGAVLLPFWVIVATVLERGPDRLLYDLDQVVAALPCTLVGGAALGYLAGTLLAGFFLLLDMVQRPRKVKDEGFSDQEVTRASNSGLTPTVRRPPPE